MPARARNLQSRPPAGPAYYLAQPATWRLTTYYSWPGQDGASRHRGAGRHRGRLTTKGHQ